MNARTVLLVAALGAACGTPATQSIPAPAPSPIPAAAKTPAPVPLIRDSAVAVLRDLAGRNVGRIAFADTYAGLLLTGEVTDIGLGAHAIHIDAVGKCEPPFTSAGGHFNPTSRQHGFKNPHGPHLGDLPDITTPAAGVLHFDFLVADVTLRGRHALLDGNGAAIVIDSGHDDYLTDPAGNSGGHIACGVIVAR